MAAYALLNAFAGFSFDMAAGQIGFQPVRMEKGKFRAFWSLAPGWGDVNIERKKAELRGQRRAWSPVGRAAARQGEGEGRKDRRGGGPVPAEWGYRGAR